MPTVWACKQACCNSLYIYMIMILINWILYNIIWYILNYTLCLLTVVVDLGLRLLQVWAAYRSLHQMQSRQCPTQRWPARQICKTTRRYWRCSGDAACFVCNLSHYLYLPVKTCMQNLQKQFHYMQCSQPNRTAPAVRDFWTWWKDSASSKWSVHACNLAISSWCVWHGTLWKSALSVRFQYSLSFSMCKLVLRIAASFPNCK